MTRGITVQATSVLFPNLFSLISFFFSVSLRNFIDPNNILYYNMRFFSSFVVAVLCVVVSSEEDEIFESSAADAYKAVVEVIMSFLEFD